MATTRASFAALTLLATPALAAQALQSPQPQQPTAAQTPVAETRLDAVDAAERARVATIVGDLGMPELPPLTSTSPRDQLEFSDRYPVLPKESVLAKYKDLPPAKYLQGLLPAGAGGTETAFQELFWYQTPAGYDNRPKGKKQPLVVAYHGYGASANSVSVYSTIDEECNKRGWFYMAPTGLADKLFGSPPSQTNTTAAVQWMLDNFEVDPDRIYMVGFSMGAGVVTNFAATHTDPAGPRIAAVGIVSGTYDWAVSHALGTSLLKSYLEHPMNFGGPPSTEMARYQASSALCFEAGSYPPLPGKLMKASSQASTLGDTPIYITWDEGDVLPLVAAQQPKLVSLLTSIGRKVEAHPVTGTASTHSWSVLDEEALFDFFAKHVAPPPVTAVAGPAKLGKTAPVEAGAIGN